MIPRHGGSTRLAVVLEKEVERSITREPSAFPHYSEDGKWCLLDSSRRSAWSDGEYEHGNWTFGFWYGVMWLAGILTGNSRGPEAARGRLDELVPRAEDETTHDLGFLFWPSIVVGNKLGFVPGERLWLAESAAINLAKRFNERGGYIQAFGAVGHELGAGTSTVDTLMNLPLLWWAGGQRKDVHLLHVAREHALTTAREFLREDGSTYHLLHFEPRTGSVIRRGTFQGAKDDSCWSRGQAWAISGFASTYAATREAVFLEAAERTAEYFWKHLPADGIPPWDYGDRRPDAPTDASASAIAALGALLLGDVHPDTSAASNYRMRGEGLLRLLASGALAAGDEDGVLQRSSYSVPHGLGLSGATAWGDFYFTLAYAVTTGALSLSDLFETLPADYVRRHEEGSSE